MLWLSTNSETENIYSLKEFINFFAFSLTEKNHQKRTHTREGLKSARNEVDSLSKIFGRVLPEKETESKQALFTVPRKRPPSVLPKLSVITSSFLTPYHLVHFVRSMRFSSLFILFDIPAHVCAEGISYVVLNNVHQSSAEPILVRYRSFFVTYKVEESA